MCTVILAGNGIVMANQISKLELAVHNRELKDEQVYPCFCRFGSTIKYTIGTSSVRISLNNESAILDAIQLQYIRYSISYVKVS